ncbi:MAG: hypothetical protein DHS20C14_02480 [Phycisphaeraceae bacterium]|nr:MAG: hypothetical protein DHS20C14_02480 [Phycisphaeraceae bacterium]
MRTRTTTPNRVRLLLLLAGCAGAPAAAIGDIDPACSNPHVHQPLLDILPVGAATDIAVRTGDWSRSTTWASGMPPADDATVMIPEGVTVTVDDAFDARLDVIRVDGTLRYATDRDTRLIVDTLYSSPGGIIEVGSAGDPVQAGVTAELIIRTGRPIDTVRDPQQVGRGLVPHGRVSLVGSDVLDFAPLAVDALVGDGELIIELTDGDTTPLGWAIGDTIVLAGTSYDANGSDADNSRFRDEVLTITAINGDTVSFVNEGIPSGNRARLLHDHARPAGYDDERLNVYVANLTRNVIVRSEDPAAPIAQRGHVMVMHTSDALIENAAFYDLGRSDKNRLLDDPGTNLDGSPGGGTNVRGRYAVHFHRNLPRAGGIPPGCPPAVARGNAVWGSPGWGLVHHDSYCVLEDNVVFDVVGSAIVAEAGNEIGRWQHNLTIKTTGDDDPAATFDGSARVPLFDFGFNGEGYWVQGGAQVEMIDNAASSAMVGMDIFNGVDGNDNRDKGSIPRAHLAADDQYIVTNGTAIDVTNVPLKRLRGLEVSNSEIGLIFWNHMRNDDGQLGFVCPCDNNNHRERSLVEDFRLWNIFGEGVFMQYSTQIDFRDGFVLGDPSDPVPVRLGINGAGRGHGIGMNGPAQRLTFDDLRIEGFERGIRLPREGLDERTVPYARSRLMNSVIANNTYPMSKKQRNFGDPDKFPDYFEIKDTSFGYAGANDDPVAWFDDEPVGDEGIIRFDAGASFDPDPPSDLELAGDAIASYAWDFDGDTIPDDFGRVVHRMFESKGPHAITLTVYDAFGATASVQRSIKVDLEPYAEMIADPGFDAPLAGPGWQFDTARPGEWFARDGEVQGGAARMLGQQWGVAGLGQIAYDDYARRGTQRFSFDLTNTEGGLNDNRVIAQVWGIHGEFLARPEGDPPRSDGAVPMVADLLLEETIASPTAEVSFAGTFDAGEGYEFFLVQFRGLGINHATGDDVRIDNVSVTGSCSADLTGDDNADAADIDAFITMFLSGDAGADLSGDGTINIDDVDAFVDAFLAGC